MTRLIFDSSTNLMYVGLGKDNELIDHTIRVARQDHAKYLVDRIDSLLKRNNLELSDVDEIIVGVGPGSYTGIRISVTVAKMLGYAKKINVKQISSLYFLTSGYENNVCAMIDARRGYVFAQIFNQNDILLDDTYIELEILSKDKLYKNATHVLINDNNYKINLKNIINQAKPVSNIHNLVPNYLRKTEAENNL